MKIWYLRDGRKPWAVVVQDEEKIGWSICHKRDQFRRDIGREIAIGRARKYGKHTNFIILSRLAQLAHENGVSEYCYPRLMQVAALIGRIVDDVYRPQYDQVTGKYIGPMEAS